MQDAGAYVDQIPPGARPPPSAAAPAPRVLPLTAPLAVRTPPAGLYVQVASAADEAAAVQAGLAFAQRLGADRPPFIRGVNVQADGGRRVQLYAGPFAEEAAARRFCAGALPEEPCVLQGFDATGPVTR